MRPRRAAVGGFPNAALTAACRNRREQSVAYGWMEHDRVARYGPEPGNVSRPQLTPLSRDTNIPSLPSVVCVTPPRHMWLASNGSTTRQPIRVGIPVVSAGARICQLSPPSMDRKMPTPGYESADRLASPVPQYTMDGLVGSTASAPILRVGWLCHNRSPVLAAIVALPNAAAGGAGPEDVRSLRNGSTTEVKRPPT